MDTRQAGRTPPSPSSVTGTQTQTHGRLTETTHCGGLSSRQCHGGVTTLWIDRSSPQGTQTHALDRRVDYAVPQQSGWDTLPQHLIPD